MDLTIRDLRRHALSFDPEFSRLETIIEGLNNALKHLYDSELCIDWYGCMDEKYECETIYRLAILAFETYITSSATNLCNEYKNPQHFYNLSPDIILILTLSEYITSNTESSKTNLNNHNLDINNSPIYHGIKILNKERNLSKITKVLKSWRNQLVYIQYPVNTN
ncbi:hypothetical protein [Chryseobacterium taiwanense]|uniref:Uncharacterized protein n=1 Tax=Chryseobacterium taiwanense TaxID=363331 RepID=A0A0B4E8W1_9FLAO|nr:hypothetical protein [Chryseobacterium taiwanense]KIC63068.1 hypothetical protein RM51_10520 [Chryseobacterium taiwanense]